MRRGELAFEYDCQSDAVHIDRVGLPQIYAGRPDDFNPPTPVDDSITEYSHGGNRKLTTVFGSWYVGSIRIPVVSGDRLPLLTEFLESIREERVFTVRSDYLPGVMRPLDVFVPAQQFPHSRIRNCDKYALVLPYQTVGGETNTGKPASVAAMQLTAAVTDTESYGVGAVDNAVTRYAYFVFEGTEATRTLTYQIAADAQVIVTLNGVELERYAGASVARTRAITSDMQTAGTNSLRFELPSITDNWSVQQVSIS